jgi:hypothetical protein
MRQVLVLDRIVFILRPDTGISISFVGEKIHCLVYWIYKLKKCLCFFCFFFNTAKYLVYQIRFRWDQSSEMIQNNSLTFQRRYMCIVSGKWDNTNTVFLGIRILRQYSVLGDTCIVSPLLHSCSKSFTSLYQENSKGLWNSNEKGFHAFFMLLLAQLGSPFQPLDIVELWVGSSWLNFQEAMAWNSKKEKRNLLK